MINEKQNKDKVCVLENKRNMCLEKGLYLKSKIDTIIKHLCLSEEIPYKSKTDNKIPVGISGCAEIVVIL
jgi:hypothetical protein